jgi:hypothetical protein
MKRYETVSGLLFTIISLLQLTRTVLGWPARVDGFDIPVWWSGLAFLITGALAIWAFRSASQTDRPIDR